MHRCGLRKFALAAVLAAAATPLDVIRTLNAEIAGAMRESDVRERLLAQGAEPLSGPLDDLHRLLAHEREVWGRVIREARIKPE